MTNLFNKKGRGEFETGRIEARRGGNVIMRQRLGLCACKSRTADNHQKLGGQKVDFSLEPEGGGPCLQLDYGLLTFRTMRK